MDLNCFQQITDQIKELLKSKKIFLLDSYYTKSFLNLLNNRINTYINYVNFKVIYDHFKYYKNKSSVRVLDLGCGIGDKSILLKKIFPSFNVYAIETLDYDDPEHNKYQPKLFYKNVYKIITNKYGIEFGFYDGINLPFKKEYFDMILLYAVIEHIKPEKRAIFIRSIGKKLKTNGYFIIARCPRYWGIIEFISRLFNLGAHKWVLKKQDLLDLFPKYIYKVESLTILNNIPNNYLISSKMSHVLICLDKILLFLKWPFATDYLLIMRKLEQN